MGKLVISAEDWVGLIPYFILYLSVIAIWTPKRMHLWVPFYLASILWALVVGRLEWFALVPLIVTFFCCVMMVKLKEDRSLLGLVTLCTFFLGLGLMYQLFPGFNHWVIYEQYTLTPGALPSTSDLSFDTTSLGIFLLVTIIPVSRSLALWKENLTYGILGGIVISCVIFFILWSTGFVDWELNFVPLAEIWLTANLLQVALAEEAFYRGFIQIKLEEFFGDSLWGTMGSVFIAGLLFGLKYYDRGMTMVFISTLMGVCYGLLYFNYRRIEVPILAHFIVSAIHFIFFTFPALAY